MKVVFNDSPVCFCEIVRVRFVSVSNRVHRVSEGNVRDPCQTSAEPLALTILIKPVKFSFVYRARSWTSATRIATCSCKGPLGTGVGREAATNLELAPPLLKGIHTVRVRTIFSSDFVVIVIRTSVPGMFVVPLEVAIVILRFGIGIVIIHEVSYFSFCFLNPPSKLRRLSFIPVSRGV